MADHTPPKTLNEHLDDVKAIATLAANRAEIAVRAADSADLAARATLAKLDEMTRLTPDVEGRPGILPWITNELRVIRHDVHPLTRTRMYTMCVVIALIGGVLGSSLHTCASARAGVESHP